MDLGTISSYAYNEHSEALVSQFVPLGITVVQI